MFLLLWIAIPAWAAPSLADLAREVRETGLDSNECYRVRDLSFQREDLKFYLNDGYLIFGKPVQGRRISAVFAADSDGGDAEFLVLPPFRGERRSMAAATGSPNLNEHFATGVMVFTDKTADELMQRVQSNASKKSEEKGVLLSRDYDSVLRNIASSFTIRLVHDLLSPTEAGMFFATVSHRRLGTIDLLYDPAAVDQISIGQTTIRNGQSQFSIWSQFPGRSMREKPKPLTFPDKVTDMELESAIDANLHLKLKAKAQLTVTNGPESVLRFDLSRRMKILKVTVDGEPAEFLERESLRDALIRAREDGVFLIAPRQTLAAGSKHQIEFEAEGDVILEAGNKVYFVTSRGIWYPHRVGEFVRYDLTFRWPKGLDLVATGDVVEERTEGDVRVSRRKVSQPVASLGFNLGRYQHASSTRDPYHVEVYANREVEKALQPNTRTLATQSPMGRFPQFGRGEGRMTDVIRTESERLPPDPTVRLPILASEVISALEFYRAAFGPPILPHLTVSPIPGTFGQGFPGMVYLSTIAYLAPEERPASVRKDAAFFSDLLVAHETAHQWWGNIVTSASSSDEWIMESLANYSALLYLEKRKGRGALDATLQEYRDNLMKKIGDQTVESTGPIIWGRRLEQAQDLSAWRAITYDKGSWIIHMLRRQLGDAAFMKMLAELRRRYEDRPITTSQFQQLAQEFTDPKFPDRKLETFFDQWVLGTGVPAVQMNSSTKGAAGRLRVSGEISVSGVDDDFLALIPVEVQFAKGSLTHWVRAGAGSTPFNISVTQTPTKVLLDPNHGVLRR